MSEPAYRIKPLEWVKRGSAWRLSKTIFGTLEVISSAARCRFFWYTPDREWEYECDSIEGGKEKAEAWYRAKLLEALEEVR